MTLDTEPQPQPAEAPRPNGASGRRRALFAFLGAGLVALIVIGAVGAFALIRARDFGDRGASATAMPPDTELYLDIDFGSLSELDRLLQAFDGAFAQAEMEPSLDTLIDQIDEELRSEFGIGVDDVTPWVGRDLGVGVSGVGATFAGGEPDLLLAVSVRDGSGADAFVQRMIGILEERDGLVFAETSYEGVTLFAADDAVESQRVVVARSGDMLLVGNSDSVVRRAVDAQSGPSLADDAVMNDLLDALPDDRAATLYLSPNLFDEILGGLAAIGPVGVIGDVPDTEAGATAMSLTLTADGIQADLVTQTLDAATDSIAGQAAVTAGSEEMPGLLPAGTFLYLGIAGPDGDTFDVPGLDEALAELGTALGPGGLAELESELGFRIREDLLQHLGGDFGLGVFPALTAPFNFPGGPGVGGMLLVGSTDPAALAETVEKFAISVGGRLLPLEARDVGEHSMWALVDDDGSDLLVLGVAGEHLVLATDAEEVVGLSGDGAKLADDEFFQEAAAALPTAGPPVIFVDLQTALRTFEVPPDVLEALAPVRGMVAGSETTGTLSRATLLTLIDY